MSLVLIFFITIMSKYHWYNLGEKEYTWFLRTVQQLKPLKIILYIHRALIDGSYHLFVIPFRLLPKQRNGFKAGDSVQFN